jgi:O-antigen ligase
MKPNLYSARLFMQKITFRRYDRTLILLVVTIGSGLILGFVSPWFSPVWTLGLLAILAFGFVIAHRPEIGLLGYLIITSTIIDNSLLPRLSIGVGRILITDIILLALLGLIFLRALLVHDFRIVPTPLDIPLIGFLGIAFLSTFLAIKQSRLTINDSLGEMRVMLSYLTFFVVTNLVREERQLRSLLRGMFFLATVVALAMIAQYALGTAVSILPGRVETLRTAGTTSYGITRVLPPGQSLVLVAFISLTVVLLQTRTPLLDIVSLIQLGVIGLSVILTFNRSFWIASALALFLVGLLASLRDKLKYAQIVFWTVLIGAVVINLLLALNVVAVIKFFDGAMVRMSSLVNPDTVNESSLQYRVIEDTYAYPQIAAHPYIGLGLGASYRPWDYRLDYGPITSNHTYIHNGYLWTILKTGFIGFLFLMCFLLLYLKRAFQNWKRIPDLYLKGIVLSFAVSIVGVLVALFVNPIISDDFWTPVMGIMLGISEVILRMNRDRHPDSQIMEQANLP